MPRINERAFSVCSEDKEPVSWVGGNTKLTQLRGEVFTQNVHNERTI